MTTMSAETEAALRQGFKYLNRWMVLLWRLGLGQMLNAAPEIFGRYMMIIHTGRKTGLQRKTPVNYAPIGDDVYCTAGFGSVSHWYQNMLATPEVELWLPTGHWRAYAEDVTEMEGALDVMRQVLIASAFAATAAGIDARGMSDEVLAAATLNYRLIRLRLLERVTATEAEHPGDLAWLWMVLAIGLLILLRPRRSRHTPA